MVTDVFKLPDTPFGQRVARRLAEEKVIWLTTVDDDGCPQPNPVWFVRRADGALLVYNHPEARRLRYLRRRPLVSLHFNSDPNGSEVIVLRGRAEPLPDAPLAHECPEYLAKYRQAMIDFSGSEAECGRSYPEAIVIQVTGVRGY